MNTFFIILITVLTIITLFLLLKSILLLRKNIRRTRNRNEIESIRATIYSFLGTIIMAIITYMTYIHSIYPNLTKQNETESAAKFNSNLLELSVAEEYDLKPIIPPDNTSTKWYNDNPEILTVDENGHIIATGEGSATITAIITFNNEHFLKEIGITVDTQNSINASDKTENNEQETNNTEVSLNNDLQESEINTISIKDVAWLDDEKIYKDDYATTMRGEDWSDCIRFGSSNINSDGTSILRVVCDQKYNKFTAEIAPQEGFDKTESVTFYIYGATSDQQTFKDEFQIDYSTKPFKVEYDLSNTDELYFWKSGNYNQGRIVGQYINGYTGMGVLMRDAALYE